MAAMMRYDLEQSGPVAVRGAGFMTPARPRSNHIRNRTKIKQATCS